MVRKMRNGGRVYRGCVCIRVGLGRGEGRGGRVPPFLHSEYKHVLLLSIHWMGSGSREVHEERNVQDAMQYRRGFG